MMACLLLSLDYEDPVLKISLICETFSTKIGYKPLSLEIYFLRESIVFGKSSSITRTKVLATLNIEF